MAYRNGTYVAFNGMGTTNPTESDMKYYALLQRWGNEKSIDFKFSDSHKKTYSVYDTSTNETLRSRLRQRLSSSKNFLLILSEPPVERGMLSWEIEEAANRYQLPFIICYTGPYGRIDNASSKSSYWTKTLKQYVQSNKLNAIHIPFKKAIIGDAISQFTVHEKNLSSPLTTYKNSAYDHFERMEKREAWDF